MSTTCFTSMYNNMYNLKNKISLLLITSITTMLAEIQSENNENKIERKWSKKKKTQKKRSNLNIFQNCPFRTCMKKSAHSIFSAWSIVKWSFNKSNHGSWIIKSDPGKSPSSMLRLHGRWCKPDLRHSKPTVSREVCSTDDAFREGRGVMIVEVNFCNPMMDY